MKFQASALDALKDRAEYYMIDLFDDANSARVHANRKTMLPSDFYLVQTIRDLRKLNLDGIGANLF